MKNTISYIDVMYDEESEWLLPGLETIDKPGIKEKIQRFLTKNKS